MNKYLLQFIHSTPVLIGFSFLFFFQQDQVVKVYSHHIGYFDPHQVSIFAFMALYTLVWFLLFPAITNKWVFKETIKEMGLALPERKYWTLFLIAIALLILIPWITYFSQTPPFQGYSLFNLSLPKFLLMMCLFPVYYMGEEFFFRGFLFLGLWKRVGWHSFWITDIIFTLLHIGKPGLEILLCIPASIVFNALTLLTRSIYPAVLVHSTMGIVMSILVTFNKL